MVAQPHHLCEINPRRLPGQEVCRQPAVREGPTLCKTHSQQYADSYSQYKAASSQVAALAKRLLVTLPNVHSADDVTTDPLQRQSSDMSFKTMGCTRESSYFMPCSPLPRVMTHPSCAEEAERGTSSLAGCIQNDVFIPHLRGASNQN